MSDQTQPGQHRPGQSLVPVRRDAPVPPLGTGGRPWREYVAPALVILLGVLAVVSFGLVIRSRADQPDRSGAAPVLGGIGEPTAAQVPIPLPSPSPSTTPAPIDSISLERSSVEAEVNLSGEGVTDWVHWGEQGRYSLERDAKGGFAILEGTPNPSRQRHTLSPERFRWTGGEPLAKASGVASGVRSCGAGNGFTLSAPAGIGPSTLRLYVGLAAARGRLEVRLSTGGEVVRSEWEHDGDDLATAAYTIDYRASETGKISVKWITDTSFDDECGGVALQAATLS